MATLVGTGAPPRAHAHEYAVVASRSVPVDEVSETMLRRLFALDRQFWKSGLPAIALFPPGGSRSRAILLRRILRTDEPGLKRMILERLYRAEIDLAPKVAMTDEEALSFISSGRGVFGLVPAALAKGRDVKVLKVQGKLPGAADYPLRD